MLEIGIDIVHRHGEVLSNAGQRFCPGIKNAPGIYLVVEMRLELSNKNPASQLIHLNHCQLDRPPPVPV